MRDGINKYFAIPFNQWRPTVLEEILHLAHRCILYFLYINGSQKLLLGFGWGFTFASTLIPVPNILPGQGAKREPSTQAQSGVSSIRLKQTLSCKSPYLLLLTPQISWPQRFQQWTICAREFELRLILQEIIMNEKKKSLHCQAMTTGTITPKIVTPPYWEY